MSPSKKFQNQRRKPGHTLPPNTKAALHQSKKDFKPRVDDIATRAYFSFLNQGSLPGHDVQHWLEAEAGLLVEHNLILSHGLRART